MTRTTAATTGEGQREKDSRFRALFENSPDAMVIADDEGRYLEVNQAACDLFGYPRERMLAMRVGDLMTSEETRGAAERYRAYMGTGRETGEFAFFRADGQWRVASYSACRLTAGEHLSILRDVTDRKQAEEQMRQSETRFRLLVEQSPLSIQILSPDGYTLRVNRAWEELWGLTLEDLRGYNMLEDRQLAEKGILPFIRRGFAGEAVSIPPVLYDTEQTLPNRTQHADPRRWTQAFMYPVKDEAGRIREVVLIHEDITERKRMEEAVRESEKRMRLLADNAPAYIMSIDTGYRYLFVNRAAAERFGLSPDEVVGKTVEGVLGCEAFETIRPYMERAFLGETVSYESPVPYEQFGTRYVQASYAPDFAEDGSVRGLIGVIHDITPRKEMEKDRDRHVAEIEHLNARLRQAVQETHHRVKNNLQVLAAMVELQTMDGQPTLPASEFARLSRHIRALAAVHEVLTVQQMGRDTEIVSVRAILEKLLPVLQQTVGPRHLSYRLDDAVLPLRQVSSLALVTNELISNAVKHGRREVRLAFTVQDDPGGTGPAVATLEVSDDGPGFPPGFDPHKSANTGLQIIRNLAGWDLGGRVDFGTNEGGGGARVVLTLPLAFDLSRRPGA